MDPLTAALLASVASSAFGMAGANASSNAAKDASANEIALQKKIYEDQRGLSRPGYLTGGAAANKLAALFGISPQDYLAAYNGGGTSGFGNPNGQSDQWSSYLSSNPDVMDYWKSNAKLRQLYPNANDFAAYHYANFGQQEGRTLPAVQSTMPVGGTQQETAGGNKLLSPMDEFTASPYGQIAVSGFRGVDVPEINGAYARGGKLLSGAQSKALDERGKARMGGAFSDYTNGLRSLAGMSQTAGSQISSAASQYGTNAGNSMAAAGQARGNALSSAYGSVANGIGSAAGAYMRYGQGSATPSYGQAGYVDPSRAAYPGMY